MEKAFVVIVILCCRVLPSLLNLNINLHLLPFQFTYCIETWHAGLFDCICRISSKGWFYEALKHVQYYTYQMIGYSHLPNAFKL